MWLKLNVDLLRHRSCFPWEEGHRATHQPSIRLLVNQPWADKMRFDSLRSLRKHRWQPPPWYTTQIHLTSKSNVEHPHDCYFAWAFWPSIHIFRIYFRNFSNLRHVNIWSEKCYPFLMTHEQQVLDWFSLKRGTRFFNTYSTNDKESVYSR